MYTVPELVTLLGLSTANQVRNRIEAARDLLPGALRRGPNNQILVTEEGLSLLRDLQALGETGHTLTEAANILRYRRQQNDLEILGPAPVSGRHRAKEDEPEPDGWKSLVEHLSAEVRDLAARVASLELALRREPGGGTWWERWR